MKATPQELEKSFLSEWLNIDDAAEYLRKPRRFIMRLVTERRVRHFKHGRYIAFRKSDLDEWATSECREPILVTPTEIGER